ncbi:MAG: HDIG domain-containing protein [Gracilibacteraceae bacterium]|jgi:putative nucleotidyltransferase with HDIG domain|nr:HDIG domain-containing protein [Gracilibacteraceae bacterium]
MNEKREQQKRHFWQTSQLGLKVLLFVVFCVLITVVLSSGIVASNQNISQGEPSSELIRAPYDREVAYTDKYEREVGAAREATPDVYRVNEAFVNIFIQEYRNMFDVLLALALEREEGAGAENPPLSPERQEEIQALRVSDYYGVLSDETFNAIMALSPAVLTEGRDEALMLMLRVIESEEEGAKTADELPLAQERVMSLIMNSGLPAPLLELTGSYVGQELLSPTFVIDLQATEWAKEQAATAVTLEVHSYRANEKIVGVGEIVDERIFAALDAYGLVRTESVLWPVLGVAILVVLSAFITVAFAWRNCPRVREHWQKIIIIGILELALLIAAYGLFSIRFTNEAWNSLIIFLTPVAWTTMTVSILLGSRMALAVCVIQALYVALLADPQGFMGSGAAGTFVALFSGLAGAESAARLSRRSDFAKAGLFIGMIDITLLCAMTLISGGDWLTSAIVGLLFIIVSAILTVILTIGALPGFEYFFNITSSVRLIELANPNNPLLKSLLMEAPGTYHHSVMVGNLAETAAEEIQADSVLVRVGALYHDIGKLKRPYFFIENQFSQENPHERIAPSLSALILTSHTKDGAEMAKQYKLPESIREIIQQHHGNSLTRFFYHKALEETPDISEDIFRYAGPNPQTKEAALVMLADSVEAAVRSASGGNPGKIEGVVRKIIKEKLDGGHLNQCELTFRDLDKIAASFVKVLLGIYHTRIVYPDAPQVRKALKKPPEPPPAPPPEAEAATGAQAGSTPEPGPRAEQAQAPEPEPETEARDGN